MEGLHFDHLNEIFEERRTLLTHEISIRCPCAGEDVHTPYIKGGLRCVGAVTCKLCHGFGWVYRGAREISGLLTGITQNRTLVESGWMVPGDAVFSPPPGLEPTIGDFDKLTFLHAQTVSDGEVLMRGVAREGENAVRRTGLAPNEDRLSYIAARGVACIDLEGNQYLDGHDYVLDGRKIRWLVPMSRGTRYTIKYDGYLEWIAWVPPFERRDGDDNLGQKVLLRKKHVIELNSAAQQSEGALAIIRDRQ